MNDRTRIFLFIFLTTMLRASAEQVSNSFDSQISGRHSETLIDEQPTPIQLPIDTASTPLSVLIAEDDSDRYTDGSQDSELHNEPFSASHSDWASCLSAPTSKWPNSFSPMGAINRVLLPADPRWESQIDALMLWQANIASRTLYVFEATGQQSLNANQAQTPLTAGPRFALLLNLDQVFSVEGNYFNVQSFGGESSTIPTTGSYAMNNLAGYSLGGIDSAQIFTSGQIQSAELNWRRRTCGPITWLAGFRWVEWNQDMQLIDNFAGGEDRFRTVTGNDLYGGQIGADLSLWNKHDGPIRVNGIGKAGIFCNKARQTTIADLGAGPVGAAAIADQTSFFGEVGLNASARLTDWLSWRLGYSVFWLSAVAVPADQLAVTDLGAATPSATINTNGSVLLHGVTTGFEARW